jgi:carbon storage regulator CsrA
MTNKNLILTRKKGDKVIVQLGDQVICVVTVTNITPTQCKLGFEADSSVRIDREEVYSKKEI